MKHCITLLLFASFWTAVFGQSTLNIEDIKKMTADTASVKLYDSLVNQFNQNPSALSVNEGAILYYGKIYIKNHPTYKINFDEIEFTKLQSKGNCQKAIPKGEKIIEADPVNFEILSGLFICYKKAGMKDKADLTKVKLDLLASSILAHGSGESQENTLKIITIGDEYAMMARLKVSGISRNSVFKGSSAFDTWKAKNENGKRIDFFTEVLGNTKVLQ